MLNLPAKMASPLLRDPLTAANLFNRSTFSGNRYVDIDAYPPHVMLGGGAIFSLVGLSLAGPEHIELFRTVVDPTN
jgi:hypothetical protein